MTNANRRTTKTRPQRQTAAPTDADARYAAALRASIDWPNEPAPKDIDVLRLVLARRMCTFMGMPLLCRDARCQRTRRCVGPSMRCHRDVPLPPSTPQEREQAIADFRKALERRMEEIESAKATTAAAAVKSAPPSPAIPRPRRRR